MRASTLPYAAIALILTTGTTMVACSKTEAPAPAASAPAPKPAPAPSLFADASPLPYQLPQFDKIKEADFRPAYEEGMAQQRKEVDAIAHSAEAPTFENTIVALERSGRMLNRVGATFSNLTSSNTSDELDKIQAEMAPKLSAHNDAIFLDPALYARVDKLYQDRANLKLDPESLRLVERYDTLFLRAGAKLSDADKDHLRQLNAQISSLTTQFQQTVLKATQDAAVVVDKESDLDGLPADRIAAAANAAKTRKLDGKWVIAIQNTTGQAVLASLKSRELRQRVYQASIGRGQGGASDNTATVAQIVKLRAQKATLLGYKDFAEYALADETAKTPEAVNKMLAQLAAGALVNARKDAAELQKLADADAKANKLKPFQLEPWDWAYYAEQLRQKRYAFDESQVKPYFELEHVLQDGVFYAANKLYGLTFKERKDLPVYQKDVRVFEVFNEDGTPLALFLADYFARDNKQGGAWMSEYVTQSKLLGLKPVVVNNVNIPKPPEGQPVLVSFDDVNGMFHEFGHALHGMFSSVQYPQFGGTAVPSDFVEYPSQFNEMWSHDPQVLANYAKHYQTGDPMPKALLDKVLAARKFNEGFTTGEYLAAAMMDQSWHQITADQAPEAKDVMAFEAKALKDDKVDYALVPPRYHTPYFQHVFASQYAAGYYAYIWSDVLAKDSEHWINTHGGLKRENGDLVRAKVLSRGFSGDPSALFKDFYGRDPEVGPLLEARGLTAGKK